MAISVCRSQEGESFAPNNVQHSIGNQSLGIEGRDLDSPGIFPAERKYKKLGSRRRGEQSSTVFTGHGLFHDQNIVTQI